MSMLADDAPAVTDFSTDVVLLPIVTLIFTHWTPVGTTDSATSTLVTSSGWPGAVWSGAHPARNAAVPNMTDTKHDSIFVITDPPGRMTRGAARDAGPSGD